MIFIYRIGMRLALMFFCVFYFCLQAQTIKDSNLVETKLDTFKRKDLFDIIQPLFNLTPPKPLDTTQKQFNFSILPLATKGPSGGKALVTAVLASFYLGNRKSTNLSEIWFIPYFDFKGGYGLPIHSYLWLEQNKWTLNSDMRIIKYSQDTWGLGNSNSYDNKLLIKRSYFRFYQHFSKQVSPGVFIGLGYDLDINSIISSERQDKKLSLYTDYHYGTENGVSVISSGINFNFLYDNKNGNSINPSNRSYLNIEYRTNPKFLGSDHWWHSLYLDARKYYKLTSVAEKQNMIALWSYFWTTLNSNPPYFDLPSIGRDTWANFNPSARGFEQGQFRAKSLFYSEAEYRRDITRNGLLGFVLFANVNSINGPNARIFSKWNTALGGGLRIKVDKASGTNISIDYAVSRNYQGLYFTLGEYF